MDSSRKSSRKRSKPLVGQIDPVLCKSRSFSRDVHGTPTSAHLTAEQKLYRYRYSKDHVYLPEVRQHALYDNAEQVSSNYPDIISAIMVIASIGSSISVVMAIFLHYGFRVVLDEDWSQMKEDCLICWKYMTYKSGVSLDDEFTKKEQVMVPLISIGIAISTAVWLRFFMKPFIASYGKTTTVAFTIIWYLVMGVGELLSFNLLVSWSTPVQKVGVNVFWLVFDGPYCVYLGSKLMKGKLRLKQSIPAYYFYSTVVCLTFLACFSSCLILKKIHGIRTID